MNLNTQICSLFNIEYPIIQAGMAGGITSPGLVAAVSNAGGLGTLAAGYLTPEVMREEIQTCKSLTNRPFAVNLFRVNMASKDGRVGTVVEQYQPIYEELGIQSSDENLAVTDNYGELFAILIEEEVPVISTTFGIPTKAQISEAQERGIKIITMVTTVEEALAAEEAGVHAVVAQGSEAGGHRGTFNVENLPQGELIGTMALVPQVVDQLHIPVIASGGIMDGRGLVAALALGAEAVQLGSRFLTAAESGTDGAYRQALMESKETSTVITRSFSGRPARGIKNKFIEFNEDNNIEPLAYPIQNMITGKIRKAAKQKGQKEYLSLWAGQGNRLIKAGQTAKEIVTEMIDQAQSIMRKAK